MNTMKHSIIWLLKVFIIGISLCAYFIEIAFCIGCALGQDLALLANGDLTEVGEKGK